MLHFKLEEFDSPDAPGSSKHMSEEFLNLLDRARDEAGIPFVITSGYRTKDHNIYVGGVENSSHREGLAADISCTDSASRLIIIESLLYIGFRRIGIGSNFIHVDLSKDKTQDVIWVY